MDIYTIGHSNYTTTRLIEMLRKYSINCVIDIRGTPYSKYNKQFDKDSIRYTLMNSGFIYIYMARELAAKRENRKSYNKEGYCDFEKVISEEEFKKGIYRLRVGCEKGYKIALLGAMQDPIRCHRAILLGRALESEGFHVKHIVHDGSIKNQEYIEECLLEKYFSNRMQITIDNILGNESDKEELIQSAYKLANKEIGFRIENIK